jgi:hypothetical protein
VTSTLGKRKTAGRHRWDPSPSLLPLLFSRGNPRHAYEGVVLFLDVLACEGNVFIAVKVRLEFLPSLLFSPHRQSVQFLLISVLHDLNGLKK